MIIAIYSILQWRPRKVGIRALSLHPILSRKQFRKVDRLLTPINSKKNKLKNRKALFNIDHMGVRPSDAKSERT